MFSKPNELFLKPRRSAFSSEMVAKNRQFIVASREELTSSILSSCKLRVTSRGKIFRSVSRGIVNSVIFSQGKTKESIVEGNRFLLVLVIESNRRLINFTDFSIPRGVSFRADLISAPSSGLLNYTATSKVKWLSSAKLFRSDSPERRFVTATCAIVHDSARSIFDEDEDVPASWKSPSRSNDQRSTSARIFILVKITPIRRERCLNL